MRVNTNKNRIEMITLIQYLTIPKLPREYEGEIYKHLFKCAVVEGLVYITIAALF